MMLAASAKVFIWLTILSVSSTGLSINVSAWGRDDVGASFGVGANASWTVPLLESMYPFNLPGRIPLWKFHPGHHFVSIDRVTGSWTYHGGVDTSDSFLATATLELNAISDAIPAYSIVLIFTFHDFLAHGALVDLNLFGLDRLLAMLDSFASYAAIGCKKCAHEPWIGGQFKSSSSVHASVSATIPLQGFISTPAVNQSTLTNHSADVILSLAVISDSLACVATPASNDPPFTSAQDLFQTSNNLSVLDLVPELTVAAAASLLLDTTAFAQETFEVTYSLSGLTPETAYDLQCATLSGALSLVLRFVTPRDSGASAPPTPFLSESAVVSAEHVARAERTAELTRTQAISLPWIIVLCGLVLFIDIVICLLSKFAFKDPDANYVTLIQCSLSLLDFTSDVFFLATLAVNPEFYLFLYIGLGALGGIAVFNLASAIYVIISELKAKPKFAEYAKRFPAAMAVCFVLAPIKANFILMLDTRLFVGKSALFDAPMPNRLRTKFRIASFASILCKDIVQLGIVAALQVALLGGWTPMNCVTFGLSALSLVANIGITLLSLTKTYKVHKVRESSRSLASSRRTTGSGKSFKSIKSLGRLQTSSTSV